MFKPYLLATLLIFVFAPVQSYARSYIVEAIVFTNEGAAAHSNEQWDSSAARNQSQQNKVLSKHANARNLQNPRSINRLAGIYQALNNSAEHRVLKTLSWSQSEASYASSPLVKFTAQQLIGAIKVYAPNLLFAELNLRYTASNLPSPNSTSLPSYFIDEKRRLKLNEIHYFDHPKFGVILSVRPI